MEKVTFPKQTVLDALYDGPVEDEIIGKGRWTIHHRAVLEIEDRYYEVTYEIGATESQEEWPWEYVKEVECVPVHKVTKLVEVTKWEPIR